MMDSVFYNAFILFKLTREHPLTYKATRKMKFKNFKRAIVLQLQNRAAKKK